MKIFSSFPSKDNRENWEIFNHEDYLKTSENKKREIRRSSCIARYNIEKDTKYSWMSNYFFWLLTAKYVFIAHNTD
jgi:hypothetical protein